MPTSVAMLLGVRSVQQLYDFKSSFKNRELMSEKITVTFYALGDSLTVGYQSPTPEAPFIHNRPYTVYLGSLAESLLNALQLNHIEVLFVNAGVNGDTTEGMLSRFSLDVPQKKPSYVIVWGGINDLYYEIKPEKVMYNLAKLWRKAEEIGAKCIACTLAPVEDNPSINELVRQTNLMIVDNCKANDMLCVDIYSALVDNEGKLAHRFSNDTLHLTTEGYEAVAQAIFQEAIRKILENLTLSSNHLTRNVEHLGQSETTQAETRRKSNDACKQPLHGQSLKFIQNSIHPDKNSTALNEWIKGTLQKGMT